MNDVQRWEFSLADFDGDEGLFAQYEAQQREWGKWVAVQAIPHGNAVSANAGDRVPTDVVEKFEYARRGLVVLQPAWIAAEPDDRDVQTFLAWAAAHPEHPYSIGWEEYRTEREKQQQQALDENPFAAASAAAGVPAEPVKKPPSARPSAKIPADQE